MLEREGDMHEPGDMHTDTMSPGSDTATKCPGASGCSARNGPRAGCSSSGSEQKTGAEEGE
jgi:hypothetical protein